MKRTGNRLGRRSLALAVAAGLALAPVAAAAETLTDALIAAYRNSDLLERNRATLRAADEDVATAIAELRPTLDFVANFSYTNPISAGAAAAGADNTSLSLALQADFVIFAGGRGRLAVEAARETVLATRHALVGIEQDVLLSAVRAYLDVRSALAFVDLRRNNVRLITEELRAARDRFEVGEVTRTDVALAESRLASARSLLAAAEGDLAVAREAYNAAVGRFPQDLAPVPAPPEIPPSEARAKAIAQRTHPSVLEAQRNVVVADISVQQAEAAVGPTVSSRFRAQRDENDNASRTLSLTYNQPIYAGGRLPALERQAIARRDAARSALHQTVRVIEQQVGNAWAQLRIAEAQIEAADRQIRAARIAFEGTREEARLGARTTLDVLDAEQELLDARATRIDAGAQRYAAIYQLLSAMGLLTVEHLDLGIPTYDPAAYYDAVKTAPAALSPRGRQLDRVLERLGRE